MSFDEQLIEAVRLNPILYDLKHKNYRRVDIKDKLWQNIAKSLKSTVKTCKNRWKSLRDAYRRSNRFKPSGSAADDFQTKQWKYYDLMNFLCSVDNQRHTVGNFEELETSWESTSNYSNIDNTFSEPENDTASEIDDTLRSTPLKKIKKSTNDDIHKNFKNFLDDAAEAVSNIDKSTNNSASSTSLLFTSLAMKIDNANLPSTALNDLERNISDLVYNAIRDNE